MTDDNNKTEPQSEPQPQPHTQGNIIEVTQQNGAAYSEAEAEADDDTTNESQPRVPWYKSPKNWLKIIIVLVLVTLLVLAIIFRDVSSQIFRGFLNWMIDNTAAGAFAFIGIYFLATILMVPGSLLTLGAGFVFRQVVGQYAGIFVATCVVFCGAASGASAAFLLGRFVLRDKVEATKKKYPKFAIIDKVIELNGLKVTLLLRLSPIIPFNVFNYAMGLTPVSFRHYNIAHVGMIPGTLAYCFIGGTLSALADAGSVGFGSNPVVLIITVVGTVIAFIGMLYIAYVAKKEFAKLAAQVTDAENESIDRETAENPIIDEETTQKML